MGSNDQFVTDLYTSADQSTHADEEVVEKEEEDNDKEDNEDEDVEEEEEYDDPCL